jgi:hypothetical protein
MCVSLKTESLATQCSPDQQYSGGGNYQQRDQLLPVHGVKITPNSRRATRDFKNHAFHLLVCAWQNKISESIVSTVFGSRLRGFGLERSNIL